MLGSPSSSTAAHAPLTAALEPVAPATKQAETPAPSRDEAGTPGPLAFNAFMTACKPRRPGGRAALCWTLAGAVHAALLVVLIVHGFWQVDELASPRVKVSLQIWAPPPPLPPPPAPMQAKASEAPRPARRPKVQQPTPATVPPSEPAIEEPAPEPVAAAAEVSGEEDIAGEAGGEAGGAEGGVVGGVVGAPAVAAPPPPPRPTLTAAERDNLLARYLENIFRNRIRARLFYPPEAEEEELEGVVQVSVVIDSQGRLVSARVVSGSPEILNRAALETVRAAQPFPPPPALLGDRVEVKVPLTYRLAG